MHLGNNGSVFTIFLMITEFLGFTLLFQHHRNSNEQAASGLQEVLFTTSATRQHHTVIILFLLDNTNFRMGSISAANAEFCFDVFNELKVQHTNENILYSPLSIIVALAMVYMGARGNTEYQMEKVSYASKYKLILILVNRTSYPWRSLRLSPLKGPAAVHLPLDLNLASRRTLSHEVWIWN